MLMKKTVFKSLDFAKMTLSSMALAPYTNKLGEDVDEIEKEYTNQLAEYTILEDGREFSIIVLWGVSDVFFVHDKDPDNLVILDDAHDEGVDVPKIAEPILQLLKRCMLVGYVPKTLLKAIREHGRESDFEDFDNVFGELIEYVETVLEGMESPQ